MIDGVELALLDQVDNVRRLDHGDTRGLQQCLDAVDETVQVSDVREHIVGQEDIRLLALDGSVLPPAPW